MLKPVVILHKKCGRRLSKYSINDFMDFNRLCGCRRRLTFEEVAQRLNQRYPDFELLDYDGSDVEAGIRHKVCGRIMYDAPNYFKGVCTCCKADRERETKLF